MEIGRSVGRSVGRPFEAGRFGANSLDHGRENEWGAHSGHRDRNVAASVDLSIFLSTLGRRSLCPRLVVANAQLWEPGNTVDWEQVELWGGSEGRPRVGKWREMERWTNNWGKRGAGHRTSLVDHKNSLAQLSTEHGSWRGGHRFLKANMSRGARDQERPSSVEESGFRCAPKPLLQAATRPVGWRKQLQGTVLSER